MSQDVGAVIFFDDLNFVRNLAYAVIWAIARDLHAVKRALWQLFLNALHSNAIHVPKEQFTKTTVFNSRPNGAIH